jgi:hypothetical protein
MQSSNSSTLEGTEPVITFPLNLIGKYSNITPIDEYLTADASAEVFGRSMHYQVRYSSDNECCGIYSLSRLMQKSIPYLTSNLSEGLLSPYFRTETAIA